MSFKHTDYFFDYTSYKDELLSLTNQIESGNLDRLSSLVQTIRKTVGSPDKWILYNKGTSIGNIGFDKKAESRDALIGHWLLIVLSKFLSPAKSLEYHWNRLFLLLRTLGWEEKDVHELIFGNSVATLLHSDYVVSTKVILKWSDPYWMWIRPERSIYCGWLSIEKVFLLRERIKMVKNIIIDKNKPFPEPLTEQQFTRKEIEDLLSIKLSNYSIAKDQNLGVFSICYEED